MPTNEFLVVAGTGTPNVVSQATYAASAAIAAGYGSGVMPSAYFNKSLRQGTTIASVVAQFIGQQTGQNTMDDGTTATLLANLLLAVQAASAAVTTAVTTTGGSTTLTTSQAAAATIHVTGALASNATIVFPNTERSWSVVNKTSGAYTLTVIGTSGAGVTVTQGKADRVTWDGANMVYGSADTVTQALADSSDAHASTRFVQRAVAQVGGYYQDTGAADALVITTIPVTGAYVDGMSFRIRIAATNATATPTLNAGAGAVVIVNEAGGALEAGDLPIAALLNVTYEAAISRWVANELLPSQYLDSPAFINNPTAPTQAPGNNSTRLATTAFVQVAQSTQTPDRIAYMLGALT